MQHRVIRVKTFQTEKKIGSLVRTPIQTHEGDQKWPLFVNKQLFRWLASVTLDNTNDVLTDF